MEYCVRKKRKENINKFYTINLYEVLYKRFQLPQTDTQIYLAKKPYKIITKEMQCKKKLGIIKQPLG